MESSLSFMRSSLARSVCMSESLKLWGLSKERGCKCAKGCRGSVNWGFPPRGGGVQAVSVAKGCCVGGGISFFSFLLNKPKNPMVFNE